MDLLQRPYQLASMLPCGVVGLLLLYVKLENGVGQGIDLLETVDAGLRCDELIELIHLLRSLLKAQADGRQLHHLTSKNLHEGNDPRRVRQDDSITDMNLPNTSRECVTCQDRVVRLGGELILPKFGGIVVSPSGPVLRVVDDDAALSFLFHDCVDDVRPILTPLYT